MKDLNKTKNPVDERLVVTEDMMDSLIFKDTDFMSDEMIASLKAEGKLN